MRVILNQPRYTYRGKARRKRQRGGFLFNNAGKGTVNHAFDRLDRSIPGYINHAINAVIDIPVNKILNGIKKIKGKQSGGRRRRQKGGKKFPGMTNLLLSGLHEGINLTNFYKDYKFRH